VEIAGANFWVIIYKLKQELLHCLNFDELTPEILDRLIDRSENRLDYILINFAYLLVFPL
jgi:hypothetical protein